MSGRVSLLAGATLIEVDPADVRIGERVGFFNEDFAVAIGQSMRAYGQRDPIKMQVDPTGEAPWLLVVGRHRLVGAALEGLKVWGIDVADAAAEEFENLESSENLERRKLPPIENAMFVHSFVEAARKRLARVHGEMKQQQLAIKARWDRVKASESTVGQALTDEVNDTSANLAGVYGWQESAREAMGLSERDVYRNLALYRLLIAPFPELAEPLAKHPIVGENASQLKLIAEVQDEAQRRAVIEALLADEGLNAIDARISIGIGAADGPAPLAHQKHVNAVVGGLARLTPALQKRHLSEFVQALGSDDVKRQLRDILNEELGSSASDTGKLVPAVAVRASVKPDYIVCLEDGTRHLRLRPHLRRLGMSADDYLTRWQLPRDYPFTAPNEFERRRKHWIGVVRGWAARETADAR
ncbi:MucR family transcriptional regulator [Sphingobium sp. AS12]|uniref:MucR family transcriptional regulator n=1 Tax=Sphingobium sp. AS12 TaxID=2849495 RepID=UPI0020C83ED4|nr:MucR family transcriptional regulator [Sphingobium sp. AS12]